MAKSLMTITAEQLAEIIDSKGEKGGLTCYRDVSIDETEFGTELKLFPFFCAVAERSNRVSPLCFTKAIQLSCEGSKTEKAGMAKTFWPVWSRLNRKKLQVKSGGKTQPLHKAFFELLIKGQGKT
eukprot:6457135-Amphidinium_carterae.1